MSQSAYELVALAMRYVFAALMALIVLRAWRITLIDSRRAAALRRLSPQTGLSGELMVLEGSGLARRGMRYPVIREGMIGSCRRTDIRVRHASVRRKHAWFQLSEDGLTLRARGDAPLYDADGQPARTLTLADGDVFRLGEVLMLLVLSQAPGEAWEEDAGVPEALDAYALSPRDAPPRHRARDGERRLGRPIDVDEEGGEPRGDE